MASMKGPAILLAQFLRDEPPYNNLENIGRWVAGLGYKGVQIPTWDPRVIDLDKVAESKSYADEYLGGLAELGLEVTELAAHLQGQVLAMHPAYADGFSVFHPPESLRAGGHRLGDRPTGQGDQGLRQPRRQCASRHVRRIRLAHDLPLAAAAAGRD